MKIENVSIYGFEQSLRAMRNPLESYDHSDTVYGVYAGEFMPWETSGIKCPERLRIGPKDLQLAQRLIKNGNEHSKFLRTICVWVDMTLPLYIWSELDTYKVGVVRNSCSTMHTLGKRGITLDDFEDGQLTADIWPSFMAIINDINEMASFWREKKSLGEKAVRPVAQMKKLLPSSFLQRSTLNTNYSVLRNMYFQRRYHKLPEWNIKKSNEKFSICKWVETLPYSSELITLEK